MPLEGGDGDGEAAGSPGQYVLKKLFADFVQLAQSKLQIIAQQDLDSPITKCLQRGEDPFMDQLLTSLSEVGSFCLKSILENLFQWRSEQIKMLHFRFSSSSLAARSGSAQKKSVVSSSSELGEGKVHDPKEYYRERIELAVECLFCMVLVEVLTQLSVHPIPETYIHQIEDFAFKHFRAQEAILDRTSGTVHSPNPNVPNMMKVAGLYAEVIGVLSQARFSAVKRRFMAELQNPQNTVHTTISIIEGMKFLRVKMFPVEELEAWFAFLQELANWFIDCPRDRMKSAMSQLLIEILLPVAAVISLETTLPAVKKFVNILYAYCHEQAKKPRHVLEYMPLVTVVLGVSGESFFLANWLNFLTGVIVPNLRSKDIKLQRAALESLYRLLWVYVVRVKCADNVRTQRDLRTVVDTLFPRQRGVFPKNMPLSIFVKIIQFIATERLDFAMKEIILELLSLPKGRGGVVHPERMNIGLRAFLLIADQLERKEAAPPMPNTFGTLPGKFHSKTKSKHLCSTLTEQTVKKIGLNKYLPQVQKSLDQLLRLLDNSVGRPLMATQVAGKTEEELCGGDKKPKLDLLKTCVASIPRILPETMSNEEIIDLLARLTVHVDVELRKTAFSSLQNLITYYPLMRREVAKGFVMLILREVPDNYPQEMEASLKSLTHILGYWRTTVVNENAQKSQKKGKGQPLTDSYSHHRLPSDQTTLFATSLHWVEAIALVAMCSYRPVTRRVALMILKEVRQLREVLGQSLLTDDANVMDVIDKAAPDIIAQHIETLMPSEKRDARKVMAELNIFWLAEKRNSLLGLSGDRTNLNDAWALCIAGLLAPDQLPHYCPTVVKCAWPWIMQRLMKVFHRVDPYFSSTDSHKSSLRGKKNITMPPVATVDQFLWRNYLIFACCSAVPSHAESRSFTQVVLDSGVPLDDKPFSKHSQQSTTGRDLLHHVVPLLYYDGEVMEAAITALGMVNPLVFNDLVEELQPMIREAFDSKKNDAKNVKKSLRRFRENLRVRLTRVFELAACHGCFAGSPTARIESGRLAPEFEEFIDHVRNYLDSESDGDTPMLNQLRMHISGFIARLVLSLPRGEARVRLLTNDMKFCLFHLFGNWCGHLGLVKRHYEISRRPSSSQMRRSPEDLSYTALEAMSALVCSGSVFDPRGLGPDGYMYKWLDSMMRSCDTFVHTLARRTIQQLLQNNSHEPLLLNWVVDHCFDCDRTTSQLYFHALSNTFSSLSQYPCDVVTVLHVVLFKTGDPDHHMRERAVQLLQVLHSRFYKLSANSNAPDLVSALTWTYSNGHVALSQELAGVNPELTLPFFSEMVYRMEMVPWVGQRNILQYMVPWLHNVELVEGAFAKSPSNTLQSSENYPAIVMGIDRVLTGTGWGSLEGTRLVLYNLLSITSKYGDDHVKEVEELWGALCCWRKNIRITLNFLMHIARTSSNSALLQQVKKIIVCFARTQQQEIVEEVIEELKSVDPVSPEIVLLKEVPKYHLLQMEQSTPNKARRNLQEQNFKEDHNGTPASATALSSAGPDSHYTSSGSLRSLGDSGVMPMWIAQWRKLWKQNGGQPQPLPLPNGRSYMSQSLLELLSAGPYNYTMHRCNFAVMFLSELVVDMYNFEWAQFLPRILHVLTLGFDTQRPVVFEHSKKLLTNLVVVLACREDKVAASQARMVQRELSLRSPSASSLLHIDECAGPGRESIVMSTESLDSIIDEAPEENGLRAEARDLIEFVSKCCDRLPSSWPYGEVSSKSYSTGSVPHLEDLVGRVLRVFSASEDTILRTDWSQEALYWATKEYNPYASRSFQVCRALHMSLSAKMLSSVLARLVEHVADSNDGVQSYVMEVMLTLEDSVENTADDHREYSYEPELPWRVVGESQNKPRASSINDDEERDSTSSSPVKRPMERSTPVSPERSMPSPDKRPLVRATSVEHGHSPQRFTRSAESRRLREFVQYQEEMLPARRPTLEKEMEAPSPQPPLQDSKDADSKESAMAVDTPTQKEGEVVAQSVEGTAIRKTVTLKEHSISPTQSPTSDDDRLTSPPPYHRRKHSRNQSMSKPISFEDTSPENVDNETESASTPMDIPATEPQASLSQVVHQPQHVASPLSRALITKVQGGSSSQASSPCESPTRSPVRVKKQLLKGAVASTSRLTEADSSTSLILHPPIRRKGSEPSRQRVHELKSLFSRGKRWGSEDQMDATGRSTFRPSSMVESSGHKKRPASWVDSYQRKGHSLGEKVIEASDLFAELFVTSVAMLESDYESEFVMATRLLQKVMGRLDLSKTENVEKLDNLFKKINWPSFPGVQALLMKGLTASGTYDHAVKLLARITPFSTKAVFDPTCHAGLPLNIAALLPMMMVHFDEPDDFCVTCAQTLSKVCSESPSKDLNTKLHNMSAMFGLYYKRDGRYNKGSEMWASGLCRYLHDAYPALTTQVLKLLTEMLEKGPCEYHRPVMRLIHCYLKLQDCQAPEIVSISRDILAVVCQHIKSPLWHEALDILKLSVSNSASIVAPPSHGRAIPMMDIGTQALPGPTLAFCVNLSKDSSDVERLKDVVTTSSWKRPQASLRRTREKLMNLLNAFGPRPEVAPPTLRMGAESDDNEYYPDLSPSLSDEEDRMPALMEVSQQKEEEDLIGMIDDHYNFLDHLEEMEESSSNEDDKSSIFGMNFAHKTKRTHSLLSLENGTVDSVHPDLSATSSVPDLIPKITVDHYGGANDEDPGPFPGDIPRGTTDDNKEPAQKMPSQDLLPKPSDIVPVVPEVPLPPAGTGLTVVGTEFTNVSNDDIEEVWRDHVLTLLKGKSEAAAVNTTFILNRLFLVFRQRFVNLTREACNYLSSHYHDVTEQLLRSVDLLIAQFEFPRVYADVELMSVSGRLDQHLFHVIEVQNNSTAYLEKRKNVIECLSQYKDHMRQQSREPKDMRERAEPTHSQTPSGSSLNRLEMGEEALQLCWAVYQFHFQFLVFLGSYVKLLDVFYAAKQAETTTDLSDELSELQYELKAAVNQWHQDRPSYPEESSIADLVQDGAMATLLQLMEQKELTHTVHKLHVYRRKWRGEVFGSGDDDDVDVLFYLYAHHLAEKQEGQGIAAVAEASGNLSSAHGVLMHENLAIHEMVKEEEQKFLAEEQKALIEEQNLPTEEQKEPPDEQTSPTEEPKEFFEEQKIPTEEQKGLTEKQKTPTEEHSEEQRTLTVEQKAPTEEQKAPAEGLKSATEEQNMLDKEQMPSEEQERLSDEHKVPTEEHSTTTEDQQTHVEEQDGISEEHKTATEEPKTLTEDQEQLIEEQNVSVEEQITDTEERKRLTEEQKTPTEEENTPTKEQKALTEEQKLLVTERQITAEGQAPRAEQGMLAAGQTETEEGDVGEVVALPSPEQDDEHSSVGAGELLSLKDTESERMKHTPEQEVSQPEQQVETTDSQFDHNTADADVGGEEYPAEQNEESTPPPSVEDQKEPAIVTGAEEHKELELEGSEQLPSSPPEQLNLDESSSKEERNNADGDTPAIEVIGVNSQERDKKVDRIDVEENKSADGGKEEDDLLAPIGARQEEEEVTYKGIQPEDQTADVPVELHEENVDGDMVGTGGVEATEEVREGSVAVEGVEEQSREGVEESPNIAEDNGEKDNSNGKEELQDLIFFSEEDKDSTDEEKKSVNTEDLPPKEVSMTDDVDPMTLCHDQNDGSAVMDFSETNTEDSDSSYPDDLVPSQL